MHVNENKLIKRAKKKKSKKKIENKNKIHVTVH